MTAFRRPSGPVKLGIVTLLGLFIWFGNEFRQFPEPKSELERLARPIVDMHVHTTESDGDRTAEEQIRAASQLGLPHVWITDHDMIRDLPRIRELQSTGQKHSVTVGFGLSLLLFFRTRRVTGSMSVEFS